MKRPYKPHRWLQFPVRASHLFDQLSRLVVSTAVVSSPENDLSAGGQPLDHFPRAAAPKDNILVAPTRNILYSHEQSEPSRALDRLELSCDWLAVVLSTTIRVDSYQSYWRLRRPVNVSTIAPNHHSFSLAATSLATIRARTAYNVSSTRQVSDVSWIDLTSSFPNPSANLHPSWSLTRNARGQLSLICPVCIARTSSWILAQLLGLPLIDHASILCLRRPTSQVTCRSSVYNLHQPALPRLLSINSHLPSLDQQLWRKVMEVEEWLLSRKAPQGVKKGCYGKTDTLSYARIN